MTFEFEVDEYPDAPIPDGAMVRTQLRIVPCEVTSWEKKVRTDKKEAGWEWQFHVTDPEFAGEVLTKAGKRKLKWPLDERATHYILATACKGKKLTPGEIEGPGSFAKLLDELVDKFYVVRVSQSDDRKWNNLAKPLTIILSENQNPTERKEQIPLAEDDCPI